MPDCWKLLASMNATIPTSKINFTEAMSDCAAEDYRESLNIRQTANLLNAESHV